MMSKSLEKFIVNIIEKDETDRPIFVIDMDDLVEKFQQWEQCLPRIHPYYAMKCNDAPPVIEALAALGAGFDCASSVSHPGI
jgi:ornithine decarboxylase